MTQVYRDPLKRTFEPSCKMEITTGIMRMKTLVVFLTILLMASVAQAALPTEKPRWALGVSLRDADTSSLWRIGPRFTYGLTLGTNAFAHISDLRLWTLDIDYRLTVKILHHRTEEVSWFTFLEAGHVFYEVDHPYEPHRWPEPISPYDAAKTAITTGIGVAWAPHKRLGCFMRWGLLFEYREHYPVPNMSWVELDRIRLTGFWML